MLPFSFLSPCTTVFMYSILSTMAQRKIIHVDMDAFFAQVEQRDHPELRGKPVIVGGDPRSRGVVSTCSYEARKFGVHSAMPTSHAYRLCPQGIFVRGNFEAYREASQQIREIFYSYSPLVEPLSLDEAYIDVTDPLQGPPSATLIAEEIRAKVFEKTRLTCSAGVSYNKFLAKIASDINKPNGLTVITPDQAQEFLKALPVKKFFGVGKVTQKKMKSLGIFTGEDLLRYSKEQLYFHFGKSGEAFYHYVRGEDNRPVEPNRERKSIGKERTFAKDISDVSEMLEILKYLSEKVSEYAEKHTIKGYTITLKVKYSDFKQITRSQTVDHPTNSSDVLFETVSNLLQKSEVHTKAVRLLGVSLHNFDSKDSTNIEPIQLSIPF